MAQAPSSGRREAELALVRDVLRRDPRAEARFVEALMPHLRAVCSALLPNRADADEAVQQSLIRVLAGLPKFRGDASLARWARRVATNVCLRARERNQRRVQVVIADEAASQATAPSHTREDTDLLQHLARLPDAQREAIVLKYVLEYTVPEIATLLDAPLETVRSRLAHGRRALRGMLDEAVSSGARET